MKSNWLVIVVVGAALLLMVAVGVRQARHSNTTADRAAMQGDVKGHAAPDFKLKDLDGKTMRLSDLKGKAVLLNFWATWCPPCKIEIPWFVDLQKQYGPQGLQVLGVAMDDAKPEQIAAFTKQMQVNYPVLIGNDEVADLYGGVESLPTTFYIGRDGSIVQRVPGLRSHEEVETIVKATLGTASASAITAPANTISR